MDYGSSVHLDKFAVHHYCRSKSLKIVPLLDEILVLMLALILELMFVS